MTTLLIRLAGPMQSWGTQSRFEYRDTGREPSKSGVIGLLAAALGRPRGAPLDDLTGLRMGVRVNAEGVMRQDYQTVGGASRRAERGYGVAEFDGNGTRTVISHRSYLADADFLVGLEALTAEQESLLDMVDGALGAPVWPLFLGRKAFVPGRPIRLPDVAPLGPGRRAEPLRQALLAFPWPRHARHLRCVYEDETGLVGEQRMDRPLSFASEARVFLPRYVQVTMEDRPAGVVTLEEVE